MHVQRLQLNQLIIMRQLILYTQINRKQAISEKKDLLHKNNTWTLVSKLVGANIINNSWVYKIKHTDRLAINGSRQHFVHEKTIFFWIIDLIYFRLSPANIYKI